MRAPWKQSSGTLVVAMALMRASPPTAVGCVFACRPMQKPIDVPKKNR
jgi:hypothetical protein